MIKFCNEFCYFSNLHQKLAMVLLYKALHQNSAMLLFRGLIFAPNYFLKDLILQKLAPKFCEDLLFQSLVPISGNAFTS
jgi:hypothetical protein